MKHTDVQASLTGKTREALQTFIEFIERQRNLLQTGETLSLQHWAERFIEEIEYVC